MTPSPAPAPSSAAASTWPALSAHERRVIGVLIEKQKTSKTADAYPLTLNALITGCNQKSNRDPVLELEEEQVEAALAEAQKKQLVVQIVGSRVERWRHTVYENWKIDSTEAAILAELLLRGPQTEGELRGRASRMDPIPDLDALREVLRRMSERKLIVYLSPEGRGAVVTHGFHTPAELAHLKAQPLAAASAATTVPTAASSRPDVSESLQTRLATVEADQARLRATVEGLVAQVKALQEALGVSPPRPGSEG